MTFEFSGAEEDPSWIMALTLTDDPPLPSSVVTITKDNVHTALVWFDGLGSNQGIATCDRVIYNEIVSVLLNEEETGNKKWNGLRPEEMKDLRASLDKLLDALGTGIQYNLWITKAACYERIKRVFLCGTFPYYLFQLRHLQKLVSYMRDDDETRDILWNSCFQQYLPQSVVTMSNNQQHSSAVNVEESLLLHNNLLPELLYSEISHKAKEIQMEQEILFLAEESHNLKHQIADMKEFIRTMVQTIADYSKRGRGRGGESASQAADDIRRKINEDSRRLKYLPLHWW